MVTVEFQHSHIDRMPLGNLASTILTLVVGIARSPLDLCSTQWMGRPSSLMTSRSKKRWMAFSLSDPLVLALSARDCSKQA